MQLLKICVGNLGEKAFAKAFILFIITTTPLISQIDFVDAAQERGAAISYGTIGLGAGVSFFDYNNDGLDDISLAASSTNDFQFLKNVGGTFEVDNLDISSYGNQVRQINWVDYDNDGDYDFFAASDVGLTRLYRNDQNGVFVDVTTTCGISLEGYKTFGGSWGDYNNDGLLDLYVSIREGDQMQPNILYRNNGDDTFTDVTASSGLEQTGYLSFCSAWFDYDNDGYQDLYVANDRYWTNNLLYHNNGDGTFTNVSETSGTALFMDAMSTTIDDYNNDGWLDIYTTNTYPQGDDLEVDASAFLRNNGNGTFTDISSETGTDYYNVGWGSVFFDVDNDRDRDLFVNGVGLQNGELPAILYEQVASDVFEKPQIAAFEQNERRSFSNAIGDFDNDGLVDIIAMNDSENPIYLWHNQTDTSNNYLKVKLQGVQSNRMGIGSWIEISVNGEKQYNYTLCGEGYIAQNSGTEFFGVGDATVIDYVKVTWLSGEVDYIEDVVVNQTLEIIEGSNSLSLEQYSSDDFVVYPNPAVNNLTIKGYSLGQEIKLSTLLGQEIISFVPESTTHTLNVNHLSPGVYIVKIGSTVKRLIIE